MEKFHRDLIYTANTFFDSPDKEGKKREPLTVEAEVEINANAKCRIIGICIETRPDVLITTDLQHDDDKWLRRFRRWGVTRIQIGLQHTDNTILRKINRGHTREDAEWAIQYLKDNGFKVDIHIMPDLPGSNPQIDTQMFDYLYTSDKLQPDQMKIYPCEVVPWTVIQRWHKEGLYQPYAQTNERALLDVVKHAIRSCPPWIRLPRVIRDIPLSYIEGGNMYPNLRQMLEAELVKDGASIMEIRARECNRHPEYRVEDAIYKTRIYKANYGIERFISCESKDGVALFGFIRLRFPSSTEHSEFTCLDKDTAIIRELHVYGNVLRVGKKRKGVNDQYRAQHAGVGSNLLSIAEGVARKAGFKRCAVISGIGVTEYYKKRGYKLQDHFMVKNIVSRIEMIMFGFGLLIIFVILQLTLNTKKK